MKDAASKLTRDNKISAGRSARKWLCSTSLVVLAVAMPSMVHAQEWTGAVSTNWNTAANWQGGAVPGSGGVASINNEGAGWPIMNGGTHSIAQVQIGTTSGGGSLTIMNGGKLNLSQNADIGLNFAGSATVTGGGSQMNVTDNLTVGFYSNGALTVSNSGLVTSRDGYLGGYETSNGLSTGIATVTSGGQLDLSNELFIGYGAGGQGYLDVTAGGSVTASLRATLGFWADSYGALNVDGATSYFSSGGFIVGRQGRGDVLATGGGKIESASAIIGEEAGSTGTVTITTGATWEVNSALTVGALGTGTLNLAGGGKLESQIATIGRNAGGVGTATVSGAGTEWTNTGALVIGRDGNGTMTLTSNAVVNSGSVTIGQENFSTGTLTVSNGGYWTSTGTINVGLNGQGTMLLNNGVIITTGGNIGVGNGSNGSVVLSNAGVWNAGSGTITVGGSGGSGSLTTNGGGLLAQKLLLAAVGPGSSANVAIGEQSNFQITGNAEIGSVSNSTGTVTVSGTGAFMKVDGTFGVGHAGDGTLLIENGGMAVVNNTVRIGFGSDATGSATVTGAGSVLSTNSSVRVGFEGNGSLTVENGGHVLSNGGILAQGVGSTGTALLTGSGSVWDARGANSFQVGGQGDSASLTVTNGALLQAGELYVGGQSGAGSNVMTVSGGARVESLNAFVGGAANRSGSILVTGAGTEWAATGNFTIGGMADGTMTVANGANVTTTSGRVILGEQAGVSGTLTVNNALVASGTTAWIGDGGVGTLNIGAGGSFNSGGLILGRTSGSTGTVTVSGAGALLGGNVNDIAVGYGGTGSLLVDNGGSVLTLADLLIGAQTGSTGTVEVTGAGSNLKSTNIIVGRLGQGEMTVANGADVTSTAQVTLGQQAGISGTLTVNNALVTSGATAWIGNAGVGTLNIGAGGSFVGNQGLILGRTSGSMGTATVSGAGALLSGGGNDIVVGNSGAGSLLVNNGGRVLTNRDLIVGNTATGDGGVIVSGTGSHIDARTATVGANGQGNLIISNGAALNTTLGGSIGSNAGSFGSVWIHGAGSVWNVGDPNTYELLVGGAGIGVLAVENGGVVNGRVQIAQYGKLSGNGTITGNTWMTGTSELWGQQGETFTFGGDLGIHSALAKINVALGTPGNGTALFNVAGNLVLDGTLNVSNAGGFGQGVYRIFDYGGTLTDSGLDVGTMPAGTTGTVQTAVAHQVNLLVNGYAGDTQFWNGTTTTADGTIHGGNGTWRMGPTNWTNVNGSAAAAWGSQFAVFQNNPGTVTVDNSAGAITTTGMQFMGTGWTVAGDAITLNGAGGNTTIRVGDGTGAGVSHTATIASVLSGNSRLVKDDLGTLILTGANSYTGGTRINAGVLQIGDGGTAGSVAGNIQNNGTLAFNRSDAFSYGGEISGNGAIWQMGSGTTTLTDNSAGFSGGIDVAAGTLRVNGTLGGSISVMSGGTLAGSGTVGAVSVANGGILAGAQGQTLTTGNLVLGSGANINVALGAAGGAGLFQVNGNLTLDGTLNVTDAGGFGMGVYRIINYTGALTDNGLDIGAMPTLPAGTTTTVQTAMANQVNLVVDNGGPGPIPTMQFWNGATTTADGTIHGGSGTWRMGPTNWTDANGATAAAWGSQFAVFQNNPGTVTVDNSAGAISTSGMQFIGAGWNVGGDAITLAGAGGNTTVRVGDGTGAGAAYTATIASALTGASRLVKDDLGTLILTGANTYTGGTQVNAGTLQIGNGGAGGSVTGNIVNNAVLAFNHSGVKTYGDVISGSGSLSLNAGQLVLTGANTYSGGTNIASGATLRVGDGILNGSIAGNVLANGDLRFNNPGATSFGGAISGSGQITQTSGTLTLTGNSGAFAGVTRVQAGALRVDGTLGGSDVLVSGASLGGTGSITGTVTMQAAGVLTGAQGQTLTMGGLVLASDSNVNVALGTPGNTALFNVTGDLTLDGTLNVANAGGFGAGVYRIFDYGGTLTDNGLTVGTLPSGTSGTVQTAMAQQVNLLVSGAASDTQFWNGTTMTADGTIHGGSGTWRMGPTNWTDANGMTAAAWGGQFAVFQNNPAAVTVDGSAGAIVTTGMQFIGTGWTVGGDAITLAGAGGNTTVRVGDGTGAGVSHTATIASVLAGNSRLIKDDLGTLILAGANTYTGGTQINNGVLQIGNGGTSGSVTGDVLNNAVLAFNRSDATTFAGTITGSGAVRLLNGDLTLTADNAYTGLTNIAAGSTLRLGNGGTTGGVAGNIDNAGTLVFNHSNAFDVAGAISGAGVIRQVGTGLTNLTGNSSGFAGTTRVENGTLAVNGTLGGAVEILGDGRLQGAGTVGNTIVSSVIAPGNSIGTLNVAGNITFNAGSIFEVEVNAAGQSDRIVATGTATINGGTVKVLASAGAYAPSTTYTILTANGGRTGAFDGVTSNLAFLTPSLTDDANNVYLTMTRNAVSFQNVGITPNQIASGQGTESLGLGNAVYDAVLNLSADQARNAFDQLSGEIHASAVSAMVEDSRFVRNAVWDRMRATEQGTGYGVWGQAFGSWGHTDGDGNAAKMDRSIGGLFAGVDGQPFDNTRFGLVAGYSRSSFDVKDRSSSGTADNYHLGLYGGTEWGAVAFRSGLAYTWHDMDTRRNIAFPGFADSLTAGYNAGTLQAFTEVGYGIDLGTAKLEPFANLAYVNFDANGFTEKGGAAALTGAGGSADTTFTTLGLRASTSFNMGETLVTAKGMLGWRHAFGDTTPSVTMNYASGSSAFSIGGVPIARDLAVVEAGLDFQFAPTATLGVTYGGQFGSGVVDQSFKANLNVKF